MNAKIEPSGDSSVPHDPYAALRIANYRRFAPGFLVGSTGLQMMNTAIAWEVWVRTEDPIALGTIGLCRALPVVLLALPAGHVADVRDRRRIVVITQIGFAAVAAGFAALSYFHAPIWSVYLMLVASACIRAFNGPARQSFLPLIVPNNIFQNVVAYQSGIFQAAAIMGPLLAGLLIAKLPAIWPVYVITSVACLVFSACVAGTRPAPATRAAGGLTVSAMLAGLSHMWRERPVFAAILLDMLAVLFGGAVAMLPIYATTILDGGPYLPAPVLNGVLRASPYLGALAMAGWLAFHPDFRRAGPVLLWSVVAFALATLLFAFSTVVWLSILALALGGAADNISVVVRHVLVQMRTPNSLRGRVGAVNSMFIECSNELGGFESGVVAKFFGPVVSVASGGVGTLLVIGGIALTFPQLRSLGRIRPLREPDLDPS